LTPTTADHAQVPDTNDTLRHRTSSVDAARLGEPTNRLAGHRVDLRKVRVIVQNDKAVDRPPRLASPGWDDGDMLVAFSVSPLGGSDSVGDVVAEAVRVVRASGLPNRTDAMFTTIEGEWDEVMAVIKRATDVVAAAAPRVSLVIKADIRPGFTDQLTAKVEHVERKLSE
jgi:uncharacterized protein (TIGR00106 family)